MRAVTSWLLGAAASVALFGCTNDFDSFDATGTAAAAGTSSGGTGTDAGDGSSGSGGVSGGGSGGTGTDGAPDSPPDSPVDSPSDAPGDVQNDGGCAVGTKRCGAACVDVTDPDFGCAATSCLPCPVNHSVAACDQNGACALARCDTGYLDCDGNGSSCETHVADDPAHCGSCTTTCTAPHGTPGCTGTTCTVTACTAPYLDCNQSPTDGCEADKDHDPTHCGDCATDCTALGAAFTCVAGRCEASSCTTGTAECDGNPNTLCETNTQTDAQHCGYCQRACNLAHATSLCTAGECAVDQCASGWADCDGAPGNGCETNLATTTAHCGACGHGCSNAGAAIAACVQGQCAPTCTPGYGDCSTPATPAADDGCETSTASSASNCGACGRVCSGSHVDTAQCSNGRCTSSCDAGWSNCAQPAAPAADDGCEISSGTDPQNCGACGRICSTVHAGNLGCSAGLCNPVCQTGYGNCVKPAAPAADDGCEANVAFDPDNCGSCGRACASGHVLGRSCSAGECDSACQPGWGNCSKPVAPAADNGCEIDLTDSVANCGACGRACSSTGVDTATCSNSLCVSTCTGSLGNCSTPAAPAPDDGCEIDLGGDADNCGACGYVCSGQHATARACSSGSCAPTCAANFGDCQTPLAPTNDDGCEHPVDADVFNCGACGRACSTSHVASETCQAGTCKPYCDVGYSSCSSPASPTPDNGCESGPSATACGSCTNNCALQTGKVCLQNANGTVCGCNADAQCRGNGNGNSATCGTGGSAGLCVCPGPFGADTCKPGETCLKPSQISSDHDCSCNGGAACGAGLVCCQTPAGCVNLATTATSCGACGHACPLGFTCAAAVCKCSGDASCNAGSAGVCAASGNCSCGSLTCAPGERCLSNATCG